MNKSYLLKTEAIDFFALETLACCGVIFVLLHIIKALLFGRILAKAGEKAWKAWVPFVNIWTFFKIAGYKGCITLKLIAAIIVFMAAVCVGPGDLQNILYIISAVIFLAFYVFAIMACVSIQKKLNKPTPFIILLFINLIAPLWMWILALDYSKWNNKKGRVVKKKNKK
jgi:hypothetical protein